MEYTAIYSTETLKGIQYSFKADGVKEAIKYASRKFSAFPNLAIIENNDEPDAACGRLVFLNGDVIGKGEENE